MARTEELPRLKTAKAKNRELRQLREAHRFEQNNELLESCGLDGRGWAFDYYNLLDRYNQQCIGATNVNDRRYGRNIPIFFTEVDLQVARMPSRILAFTNDSAIGVLEAWTSFIGGEGMVRTVQPKAGNESKVPKPISAKLQEVIDDVAERNAFDGGEQIGLEEELIQRPEVEGEAIIFMSEDDDGLTWFDTVESEQMTQPPGSGIDYLFGVYGNPQRPSKYFLRGWNTDLHGEEYDADQIIHYKQNVTRQMKRGYPTFSFSMKDSLTLAEEVRQALGVGARDQAGISEIRQWDSANGDQVQALNQARADYMRNLPGGGTVPVIRSRSGTQLDIPKGMQFVDPPGGKNGLAHVAIMNACLRGATTRLSMPDYFATGDASANTYDNADATDSAWGRRVIREQGRQAETQRRMFWWALCKRCERAEIITALDPDGVTVHRMSWEQLQHLVEIKVTPPPAKEKDKDKEADRLTKLVAAKLMAAQDAIKELGEDPEETAAKIEIWDKRFPAPQPAAGSGQQAAGKAPEAKAEPPIAATPPKTVPAPPPEPQTVPVRESLSITLNQPAPVATPQPVQESRPAESDTWHHIPAGVLKLLAPATELREAEVPVVTAPVQAPIDLTLNIVNPPITNTVNVPPAAAPVINNMPAPATPVTIENTVSVPTGAIKVDVTVEQPAAGKQISLSKGADGKWVGEVKPSE